MEKVKHIKVRDCRRYIIKGNGEEITRTRSLDEARKKVIQWMREDYLESYPELINYTIEDTEQREEK